MALSNGFGLLYYDGPKRIKRHQVSASNGTLLGINDPVAIRAADGRLQIATVGTTNPIYGVVVGLLDTNKAKITTNGGTLAASTHGYADVIIPTGHDTRFLIRSDGTNAEEDIGEFFPLVFTAAASTTDGKSRADLDTSEAATTTEQLRMEDIAPVSAGGIVPSDNAHAVANAVYIVSIHERFGQEVSI
jgi:hypothetical protein